MNQLFLDGQLADLGVEDITLTFRSNMFGDPSKTVGNTSYTVRLPKTVNNARLLGLPAVPGSDERWHKTYHVARYLRNSVPVIKDGRAQLVAVSDVYEVLITFGAFTPLAALVEDEAKLSDIEGVEVLQYKRENDSEDYDTAMARGYFYAAYDPFFDADNSDVWHGRNVRFTQGNVKEYALASGAILTAAVGQTVTGEVVPRSGMMCVIFPFTVGDSFVLDGATGAADALPWCVINEADEVIMVAGASTYTGTVNAPINAARCIVNASGLSSVQVVDNDYVPDVPSLNFNNSAAFVLPSVSVSWVLQKIAAQYGVTVDYGSGQSFVDTLVIPLSTRKATELTASTQFQLGIDPMLNQLGTADIWLQEASDVWREAALTQVQHLTAAIDVSITFEILIRWAWDAGTSKPNTSDGMTRYHGGINGRSPEYNYYPAYYEIVVTSVADGDETSYIIGDPQLTMNYEDNRINGEFVHLAAGHGKIELKEGDTFCIKVRNDMGAPLVGQHIADAQIYGYVDAGDEVPRGAMFPICANLPEVKITDFLRTLGILTGRYLRQTSTGVVFGSYDDALSRGTAADWSERLIMEGRQTSYTLNSYGQRNAYKWKTHDRVKGDYDGDVVIDNTTLDAEAVAVELPFMATDGRNVPIWERSLQRAQDDDGRDVTMYEYSFKGGGAYLKQAYRYGQNRIGLTFDIHLQDCINAGVSASFADLLVIKVKMRLDDVTLLEWDDGRLVYLAQYGAYFAVQEITSDGSGICDVKLLRVSGAAEPTPPEPPTPYDELLDSLSIVNGQTPAIITDYYPNEKSKFVFSCMITERPSTAANKCMYGTFTLIGNTLYRRADCQFRNNYRIQTKFGNGTADMAEVTSYALNTRYNFEIWNNTIKMNGATYSNTVQGAFTADYPLVLFSNSNNGTPSIIGTPAGGFIGTIYGTFDIYEDDVLMRSYHPAKKDGRVGLWESVTDQMLFSEYGEFSE